MTAPWRLIWMSTQAFAAPTPAEPAPDGSMTIAAEVACPSSVRALAGVDFTDPRLHTETLVVVMKSARRIMRFTNGKLLHSKGSGAACWAIGLGPSPEGHKQQEGDGKTPEGWYRSSDKPWSQWYAAIAIHYPNQRDISDAVSGHRVAPDLASAMTRALKQDKKPAQTSPLGGEILIHGGGSSTDWTLGCIALQNSDIDALRATLPTAMVTDVLILP